VLDWDVKKVAQLYCKLLDFVVNRLGQLYGKVLNCDVKNFGTAVRLVVRLGCE